MLICISLYHTQYYHMTKLLIKICYIRVCAAQKDFNDLNKLGALSLDSLQQIGTTFMCGKKFNRSTCICVHYGSPTVPLPWKILVHSICVYIVYIATWTIKFIHNANYFNSSLVLHITITAHFYSQLNVPKVIKGPLWSFNMITNMYDKLFFKQ